MVRAECCGDSEISRNRHFEYRFRLQLGGVVVGGLCCVLLEGTLSAFSPEGRVIRRAPLFMFY